MSVYVFIELIPTCNSILFNSGCFLSRLWCHSHFQPPPCLYFSHTSSPAAYRTHLTLPCILPFLRVFPPGGSAFLQPVCLSQAYSSSSWKSSREPQAPAIGSFVLPWSFASVCLTCPVTFGARWKQQRMRDCEPWFLVPALCPLSFGAVVRSL